MPDATTIESPVVIAPAGAVLTLLVVDDDEVCRGVVRRALAQLDARATVLEARGAEQALQLLADKHVDCVLLDLEVPPRDGLRALEAMRAAGVTAPIIVMLATEQVDEETAMRLSKAGADDVMPKRALQPSRLLQVLRQVLRVSRAEERARAMERELDAERKRVGIALAANALGIWDNNFTDKTRFWDARTREIVGFGVDEVLAYPSKSEAVHADDRQRVVDEYARALDPSGDGAFHSEFRIARSADGGARWARARGRVVFVDGVPVRAIGTMQDITEERRSKDLLERHAHFQQQLVGIVSHDLRNPIAAMMMSAQAMMRRAEVDARMVKGLSRIVSTGERASRLIGDLLDLTQVSIGGGLSIKRRECDVNAVVAQVTEEVQQTHPDREIVLVVDPAEGGDNSSAVGEWDGDRIAQLITNLCMNAMTYSAPDSVVRMRTQRAATAFVLDVFNEGPAISDETMPTLFEPFRRAGDRAGAPGNIGLGLFIVREIVRAHHGEITVRSSADEGTTFTVKLPIAPPTVPAR